MAKRINILRRLLDLREQGIAKKERIKIVLNEIEYGELDQEDQTLIELTQDDLALDKDL